MALWYYSINGNESGPVDANEIRRLATTGKLTLQDRVRREGMTEWYPAAQVKGLFATLPAQPAKLTSATGRLVNDASDQSHLRSSPATHVEIAAVPLDSPPALDHSQRVETEGV